MSGTRKTESIASTLARTCEDLRAAAMRQHEEVTRGRAALASAGCAQAANEELADAVCRLAGERDEARAMVQAIGLAYGINLPNTPEGNRTILHRVLHIAARQQQQPAARPWLMALTP